MTGVSEIAAAYERSQRELRNFGVDADFNVGAMKQVWEGMAATLFLSAIRHQIDVIKEAAGRFGEAAAVLHDLDGAVAAAKQQIADGQQAMKDEADRNPFAAYNYDQYQLQGGWNPYGGVGGPSYGQMAVAGGQSALARAYEEAAAKLTSLASTSPTQERAAEKYFEKEMRKKGAPADVKIRDGEIKGFVPEWDTHPPWYRPDKSVTAIKAGVRSLQVLPGGPEELAEMHEKFGGGVRGFIDPTMMFQDSFLHAAEGHPFRATLQFVNGTLTIVGVGTLAKATGKGAMKVGSKIGIRTGARQAAKETPVLIPKPKPVRQVHMADDAARGVDELAGGTTQAGEGAGIFDYSRRMGGAKGGPRYNKARGERLPFGAVPKAGTVPFYRTEPVFSGLRDPTGAARVFRQDFAGHANFSGLSDAAQFKLATQGLQHALRKEPQLARFFTAEQLAAIEKGSGKIPGLTWHHDTVTGKTLNLVTEAEHKGLPHVGVRGPIRRGRSDGGG